MNKNELVAAIAENANMTKVNAALALEATMGAITKALVDGEKVTLTGFGTFEVRDRKERKGHNPRTGESITIPAMKTPAFKAGKNLKDSVK